MANTDAVVDAATKLHTEMDEAGLELLIAMRDEEITREPALTDDPYFRPQYQDEIMGLDALKALGRRIVNRWNKELYGLTCGINSKDQNVRKAILDSLNVGEFAVIAAVVSALLTIGVSAAIAAPLAPLLVKRFIWPAKEELCEAWGEAVKAQEG